MQRNSNTPISTDIQEVEVPYIPHNIHPDKIDWSNSKLLSDTTIQEIKTRYSDTRDEKISKKTLHTKYSVIFFDKTLFAIGSALEDGTYGVVRVVQNLESGEWAAMKVQRHDYAVARQEYINIVKAGAAITLPGSANPARVVFGSMQHYPKRKYYYLMRLLHGVDLFHFSNKKFPCVVWLEACLSTMQALHKLHYDLKFLHGDVKLENIVYDMETRKSAFVDWYTLLNCEKSDNDIPCTTTLDYAPIEYHSGSYNERSEVFALGVTIGNMLDAMRLRRLYGVDHYPFKCKIPDREIRRKMTTLLEKMLNTQNALRPDVSNVIFEFLNITSQLKAADRTVRIYVVNASDINVFILKNSGRQQGCELVLLDPECRYSLQDYVLFKSKLESQGYFMHRKVLRGANYVTLYNHIIEEAKPATSFFSSLRINEYHPFWNLQIPEVINVPSPAAPQPDELERALPEAESQKSNSPSLSPHQILILFILERLRGELRRLEQKYRGSRSTLVSRYRASDMMRTIRYFEDEQKTNAIYPDAWPTRLRILESQMHSTSFFGKLGWQLGLFSTVKGKKEIKKIRTQVEKPFAP